MLGLQKFAVVFALALSTVPASAGSIYVITTDPGAEFGTLNPLTGMFTRIGTTPPASAGLVAGPNGSLLSFTYDGHLVSINPATGVETVLGPLNMLAASDVLTSLGSVYYGLDFNNDLYTLNPATGAVQRIGPTGIPAFPADAYTYHSDGSVTDYVDSTFFSANGSLYETFDVYDLAANGTVSSVVDAPELYRINPVTGVAIPVTSTQLQIVTAVNDNGTIYGFESGPFGGDDRVVTLNLATGGTTFVASLSPSLSPIYGAAVLNPTPEPASILLAGLGIAALVLRRRVTRLQ